jgi:uroporphyrinogen decarboxylase
VKCVTKLNAAESVPFVGEALQQVAETVGDSAAVLGFVGAPFTLATYIVEVRSCFYEPLIHSTSDHKALLHLFFQISLPDEIIHV